MAAASAVIEPELPIVDPHHHLWTHAGNVYRIPELLADLSSGHKIRATVFEECGSMYRAHGPEELDRWVRRSSLPAWPR